MSSCSADGWRPSPAGSTPYRDAWSFEKTLGYLEERKGLEFDPELCATFVRMMRQWEPQVAVVSDAGATVPPAAAKSEQAGV